MTEWPPWPGAGAWLMVTRLVRVDQDQWLSGFAPGSRLVHVEYVRAADDSPGWWRLLVAVPR